MDEAVRIEVDGLVLTGAREHAAYLQRVRDRRREVLMAELFREAARSASTVVDVGAFLGHFTLLAGRQLPPTGRVLAFEPDPRDFPWLERNVMVNALEDRVRSLQRAAVHAAGRRPLFLAVEDQSQSSLYPGADRGDAVEVECTTVDRELDGEPAQLVKIDVEGAELEALQGMERTLEAAGDDVTLFVEWNPGALIAAGQRPDALPRRLRELGFTVQMIDEARGALRPLGSFSGVYANLYCTRR